MLDVRFFALANALNNNWRSWRRPDNTHHVFQAFGLTHPRGYRLCRVENVATIGGNHRSGWDKHLGGIQVHPSCGQRFAERQLFSLDLHLPRHL